MMAAKWYVKAANGRLVPAKRHLHRLQVLVDKEKTKGKEKEKLSFRMQGLV